MRAALAAFTGTVEQVPPTYAAVKVNGERAYALARKGRPARLEPRRIYIERLALVALPDAERATFEMRCGKGTYVRALARDLARHLGTVGHLAALRRSAVGPFDEGEAISLDKLDDLVHSGALLEALCPVETALVDIPALAVTETQADRVKCGQPVRTLQSEPGIVRLTAGRRLVALAEVKGGRAHPVRVFNI